MKKSVLAISLGLSAISFGQMTMTSSAMLGTCDCYQITDAVAADKGAIWSPVQIDLTTSFDMTFNIYLGTEDEWGADGMAFVLQQNPSGIGDVGNTLGYKDVAPMSVPPISAQSLAIEIDIWDSSPSVATDIPADHIGISFNGNNEHNLGGPYPIPNVEDGLYHEFRVLWDPGFQLMSVFLDGAFIFAYNGDIITNVFTGNPLVYFGFTGSTGGVFNEQRVCMYRNASFSADQTTVCSGVAVNFTENSTSDLNNILDYSWDFGDGSPLESTQNPSHTYAAPGDYTAELTITDASGCTDVATVTITVLPDLVIDVVGTDITCFGDDNGQAVASSQNGTGPFNYLWDDVLAQTTPTITNLGPATYNVTVTDGLGCEGTGTITILEPGELSVEVNGGNATCFGSSDAVADAVVTDGTGPYTYSWDDAASQTTSQATGLGAGTYTVTVTDNNGCIATNTWTVTEPSEIIITGNVTYDNGSGNGAIDASITGGTTPYSSTVWSNSATTEDVSGLSEGPYTITVTDANGCTKDTTFYIKSSVGITDIGKPEIVIYPNPTNGQFLIQTMGDYQVIIHDAAGRIVLNQNASDDTTINLSFAERGVYMVEIIKDDKSYFERLVLQ